MVKKRLKDLLKNDKEEMMAEHKPPPLSQTE